MEQAKSQWLMLGLVPIVENEKLVLRHNSSMISYGKNSLCSVHNSKFVLSTRNRCTVIYIKLFYKYTTVYII